MKYRKIYPFAVASIAMVSQAGAGVVNTTFTEASLAATGLSFDIPNPAVGDMVLNDANDRLEANSIGDTNMWATRMDAPIAYVTRPSAGRWFVETEIELLTSDPNGALTDRYMGGITFYEDVDGANPDFHYYFDNWPNSGSKSVNLQGSVDNDPLELVPVPMTTDTAVLRVEVEQDGGGNGVHRYTFLYDLGDGGGMQTLTTYDSAVDNSRVGVFVKARDFPNSVAFNRFQVGVIPADQIELKVEGSGSDLTFTWESQSGKVYDLLSSADPETDGDPASWQVVAGQEGIPAIPDTNVLTIARPVDGRRFYVIQERDAPPPPPVFFDDFESVPDPDWTTGANPGDTGTTGWERGEPQAFLSDGEPPATGANGSDNCFGTNLGSDYGGDTDIYLRSPSIDLTGGGITGANLTLWHYLDTDSPFTNDVGAIRILKAGDLTPLGADLASGLGGIPNNNTDWQQFSAPLPAAAIGQEVVIEFQFISDGAEFYSGWYIDEVEVSVE